MSENIEEKGMQVLAIVTRAKARTDAEVVPYRVPEGRGVWALLRRSVVRRVWSRADQPGAVLLLEVGSRADASDAMMSLPLVRDGLVEFQLIELAPFLALEHLFGPQATDL